MSISEILNNILKAIHGKDVRQSLYEGIKLATDIASEVKEAMKKLNDKFEAQIKNMTLESPSDAEIVAARTDASGKAYDTVGGRIDFVESKADNALEQANTAKNNAADALEQANTLSADLKTLTSVRGIAIKSFDAKVLAGQTGTFVLPLGAPPDISVGAKTYDAHPVGVIGTQVSVGGVMSYACLNPPDLLANRVQFELAKAPTKDVTVRICVLYIGM